MTMNDKAQAKYDELVAAIVEAVENAGDPEHYIAKDGRLWLDDVLQGVASKREATTQCVIMEGAIQFLGMFDWRTGHDLAWHRHNAPETIDCLHSLLCNE